MDVVTQIEIYRLGKAILEGTQLYDDRQKLSQLVAKELLRERTLWHYVLLSLKIFIINGGDILLTSVIIFHQRSLFSKRLLSSPPLVITA